MTIRHMNEIISAECEEVVKDIEDNANGILIVTLANFHDNTERTVEIDLSKHKLNLIEKSIEDFEDMVSTNQNFYTEERLNENSSGIFLVPTREGHDDGIYEEFIWADVTNISDSSRLYFDANTNYVEEITNENNETITKYYNFISLQSMNINLQPIKDALNNKVDKVSGKGLSSNDFTLSYKTTIDTLGLNYQEKGEYASMSDFRNLYRDKANKSDLADVATSGDYGDLINLPQITFTTGAAVIPDNGHFTGTSDPPSALIKITVNSNENNYPYEESLIILKNTYHSADTSSNNTINLILGDISGEIYDINDNKIKWSSFKLLNTLLLYITESSDVTKFILLNPLLSTVATSGSYNDLTNKPNLSTVATSGSYNDLDDKPSIPSKTSDLSNDSGYLLSRDIVGKEDTSNKSQSISTSNDPDVYASTKYPSVKAVKDYTSSVYATKIELSNAQIDSSNVDLTGYLSIVDAEKSYIQKQNGTQFSLEYADMENEYDERYYENHERHITGDEGVLYGVNLEEGITYLGYTREHNSNYLTFRVDKSDEGNPFNELCEIYYFKDIAIYTVSTDYLENDFNGDIYDFEDIENDSNFNYIGLLNYHEDVILRKNLANIAWSGDYNDLENKPIIPDISGKVDKVSGKGLSSNDFNDSYKNELDNLSNNYQPKGNYLTSHQDISGKVDKVSGKGLSSNDFTDSYRNEIDNLSNNYQTKGNYLTSHQDISGKANSADLANIATSGSYADLEGITTEELEITYDDNGTDVTETITFLIIDDS